MIYRDYPNQLFDGLLFDKIDRPRRSPSTAFKDDAGDLFVSALGMSRPVTLFGVVRKAMSSAPHAAIKSSVRT
jgi:hypothetical protein